MAKDDETHRAHKSIDIFEPILQLFIPLRIVSEHVEGVNERIHALIVGKAFQECADLKESSLEGCILTPRIKVLDYLLR